MTTRGWAARKESDRNVERSSLTRYAWLSIAAAIVTIGLKSLAYLLTGSVGLLSDAVESLVNLVAAIMALAMLIVAARPADEEHPYGHSKAEYFASGVEGILILVAAVSIAVAAVHRLLAPRPMEQPGIGLAVVGRRLGDQLQCRPHPAERRERGTTRSRSKPMPTTS